MKKNKKTAVNAEVLDIPSEAAAPDYREKLVKKAKAAKEAAQVGLIPQATADALWAEAEAACKPSAETLALAKAAKEAKDKAEKVLKVA